MCYSLLYTYSLFGVDLLYPKSVLLFLEILAGFVVLFYMIRNKIGVRYKKVLILVFSILPIIMITTIALEPMTRFSVSGAQNGLEEIRRFFKFVPWGVFYEGEFVDLYIKVPSLFSFVITIVICFIKKEKIINLFPAIVFVYIILLTQYLIQIEKLIDSGV